MKVAYFVMGPESSGTRMLTKAFCTLGIYGDYKHKQRTDDLDFSKTPDRIVIRRSLPHGLVWPAIADLVNLMRQAGYGVIHPLLILRDKDSTIKSQLRHTHAKNVSEAKANIQFSVDFAVLELGKVGLYPTVVTYEPFVRHEKVREAFFRQLGLPVPIMSFFDANEKYAEGGPGE
jgi:hypothetical protein